MVGLWHYSIPGLFLLAQFCLGILVALNNLVNNSVFLYMSDEGRQSSRDNSMDEGNEMLTLKPENNMSFNPVLKNADSS